MTLDPATPITVNTFESTIRELTHDVTSCDDEACILSLRSASCALRNIIEQMPPQVRKCDYGECIQSLMVDLDKAASAMEIAVDNAASIYEMEPDTEVREWLASVVPNCQT